MDKFGNYTCCAVIVAAGSGSRMGNTTVTKQFLSLGREPVVFRTVRQFENCSAVSSIVIVARKDEMPRYEAIKGTCTKLAAVVSGSTTRVGSVLSGIRAIPEGTDFIAIHDGARCMITPDMIENVIGAAYRFGAASAGCRAVDTLKTVSEEGYITSTPQRSRLWHAQTPQVFRLAVYMEGLKSAYDTSLTDDNSLMEKLGVNIKMIDCTPSNIKITTPVDLCVGEALLKSRGGENQ